MQNNLQTSNNPAGSVGWISKSEAARLLDKSERTVLAMAADGRIQAKQEKDPTHGQKVTLFHAGDVARLAEGLTTSVSLQVGTQAIANLPARLSDSEVVAQFKRAMFDGGAAVDRPLKPWLTINEAAEYSGLPASTVRALIDAGQLPSLDCGPRPGGRYRVKRADLDSIEGHR